METISFDFGISLGRAGRTGPGTCYRLYSQEQYDKMEPFTQSEINRISLEDMALQMLNLNLGREFVSLRNEDWGLFS